MEKKGYDTLAEAPRELRRSTCSTPFLSLTTSTADFWLLASPK